MRLCLKLADIIIGVLGIWGALVLVALPCYLLSNNYYLVGGKVTDFSIWAYSGCGVLWATALWLYCRGKARLLYFVMQFTVIVFVLDWYRMFEYASDKNMVLLIRAAVVGELLAFLSALVKKDKYLSELCVAGLITVFSGAFIVVPVIMPFSYMLLWAGVLFALKILWQQWKNLKKYKYARLLVAVVIIVGILAAVAYVIVSRPGIHFYEKPVAAVENVKVSVVVPVYNAEKTLERCLDSIRRQTLKDIEIICVNDGSTDKSGEILKKYAAHDKRFKVITQKNAYVGAARNRGMKEAKGEFIGFVDNDDTLSSDFYEKLYLATLAQKTDAAIAGSICRVKNQLGKNSCERGYAKGGKTITAQDYVYGFYGYVWNKIYRRDFLERNKIYFSSYRTVFEDYYFTMQFLLHIDEIAVADEAKYYYTIYNASASRTVNPMEIDEQLALYKDVEKFINESVSEDAKKRYWFDVHAKQVKTNLQLFYDVMNDAEDKEFIKKRCEAIYLGDMCRFEVSDEK